MPWQYRRLSVEHATAGLSDHAVRVDTPGQSVVFELADGWRRVSKEAHIPLTVKWQEHSIEFEIRTAFQDGTTLRFHLPRDVKGTFDLANTRLKMAK